MAESVVAARRVASAAAAAAASQAPRDKIIFFYNRRYGFPGSHFYLCIGSSRDNRDNDDNGGNDGWQPQQRAEPNRLDRINSSFQAGSLRSLCQELEVRRQEIYVMHVSVSQAAAERMRPQDWAAIHSACSGMNKLSNIFVRGWDEFSLQDPTGWSGVALPDTCSAPLLRALSSAAWICNVRLEGSRGIAETCSTMTRFARLRSFSLYYTKLSHDDCRALGRSLQSPATPRLEHLRFQNCDVRNFTDWLHVLEGMQKNHRVMLTLYGSFILDQSLVGRQSRDGEPTEEQTLFTTLLDRAGPNRDFELASREYYSYYRRLNKGGRQDLIGSHRVGRKPPSLQDWVAALTNEHVRDHVDSLYHFLSLNPETYAKAALEALENGTSPLQPDWFAATKKKQVSPLCEG